MRVLSLLLLCACAMASPKDDVPRGLQFIEDDFTAALNVARERNVPLFVDASASWCHSCVFLKEHVLKDPAMARNGKRYVFASIDTEKEKNAAFLEKFPVEVWPTLFIIDPKSETAVLKWMGTGTVAQIEKLLDDGEKAADDTGLVKADALFAGGKADEAASAYRQVYESMGKDHPRRARTLESLINALYSSKQMEACARAAFDASSLPRGPSFVNAVAMGLSCATSSKEPWTAEAVKTLEPLAVEALSLEGILADDKSGIYELLVDLHDDKKLALQWLSFLEGEAAKAQTPAARAVFDPHRVNAAMAAGEPLRAEAALLQSEKDLPDDYNPPARLALIYREAGRYDDALSAIERAFSKSYGPRKLRLYETKASILQKKGDTAGQKTALNEAVAYGRTLPASQRPEKTLQRLEGEAQKLK
jgi:thioredoxin-like negative regulator of GroEL